MLTVELITKLSRLQELQTDWQALVGSLEKTTPFHLPSWQLTWWKHFGSGQLQTFAFFDDQVLVGLLPCFRHEWEGAQQLTLLGSGITDFLEPPVQSSYASCVLDSLKQSLLSQSNWDICNWQDLYAETPLAVLAETKGWIVEKQEDTVCSAIFFNGAFEEYWSCRSNELKRNVRRYTQKAEAEQAVHFEVSSGETSSDLMNALIRLHSARWQIRGEPGMIAANQSADFLRDVAVQFAQQGILRLLTLRWKEQIVAIIFGVSWRNTLYGYLSAFDPHYEKLGFGRILLFNAIRYACDTGHTSWNFLRGDEPYKTWWGSQPIPKCRVIVKRNSHTT